MQYPEKYRKCLDSLIEYISIKYPHIRGRIPEYSVDAFFILSTDNQERLLFSTSTVSSRSFSIIIYLGEEDRTELTYQYSTFTPEKFDLDYLKLIKDRKLKTPTENLQDLYLN